MIKGAFLGLFIGLSFDLGIYGMANWFNDLTGVGLDILLNIIMNALVGGVIGWYYSRTKA
jgi:NhaP-type Na+/H+ or K+/H+ antiporter